MTKEMLDKYLGELVAVELKTGGALMGLLDYVPVYSQKYNYRHSGYYYIATASFKAEHVETIRLLEGGGYGID